MKLYCAALEHHDGRRVPATHIGYESDMLFGMCDECTEFYREDYPINPVLEVWVEGWGGSGGRSRPSKWGEVIPGDVVVLPPVPNGEGMHESDVDDDPNLALVRSVEMLSDRYVRAEMEDPDLTVRQEFRTTFVTVVAHENGYGTERENER